MARPPVAPPSPSFSPAGSIPLILYIHKSDRLIRFVEYAGSEGIEPPIEVLETPGIPFTYEPKYPILSSATVLLNPEYNAEYHLPLANIGYFAYYRGIMAAARFEVGASTDFMGAVWTDSMQFSRVVPTDEFPGITIAEIVGVGGKKRIAALAAGLREQKITPVQLHGATGYSGREPWYDAVKVRAIGVFLPHPEELKGDFPDLDHVIHAPAAIELLKKGAKRTPTLSRASRWLIENHDTGLGGITHAQAAASHAQDRGIPANVIVDIGHVTRRMTGKAFDAAWSAMTRYLERMTTKNSAIAGIHIPEGTFADDSLPKTLTDAHRRDLVTSLGPSVQRVIFEYQRSQPHGLLHLFGREERRERARMSRVFAAWAKAGLFSSGEVK